MVDYHEKKLGIIFVKLFTQRENISTFSQIYEKFLSDVWIARR